MENHHVKNGKKSLSIAIFNGYVKLPEGMPQFQKQHGYVLGTPPPNRSFHRETPWVVHVYWQSVHKRSWVHIDVHETYIITI